MGVDKRAYMTHVTNEDMRPVSLTSIPGKVMEQLILEVLIKQMKEKKVIRTTISMDSPRGNHA